MIKLLDKNTIDKIAAGEVIERPLSIVKELLDNSIDAGSTAITVEIKEGGLSFIRVTDNGGGIPKEEVKLAYMRHATSKLEDAKGLEKIMTLGFRGEALSTIAAVSQTEMITKTHDSLTGVKYVIHGGEEIEFSEVGVPDGTTIVARNIFYNTPARKKFLKSAMTEGSYISDLVQKIAMSHPEISFKLIINNQTKIDTSGNGNIKDTIYQLFGRDITANLIPIEYSDDEIKISGFIGKPFVSRGNRGLENYFINGRYIKSGIVNRAIEEGYKTFVMQHKFPFTVLYFELPPEKCDVNVHPTKMEFKYDNERKLFEVITKTVREALSHKEIIPKDEAPEKKEFVPIKDRVKAAEPFETSRNSIPNPNVRNGGYSPTYKILERLKANETKNNNESPNNVIRTGNTSTTNNVEVTNNSVNKVETTSNYANKVKSINDNTNISSEQNVALNLIKDSDVIYEPSNIKKQDAKSSQNNSDIQDTPDTKAEYKPFDAKTPESNETLNNLINSSKEAVSPSTSVESKLKAYSSYNAENTAYTKATQSSMFDDDFLTEKARKKHRIIGQVFGTYWLIEYEKNLYIMDQHAAHEKVKYEELMSNLDLNNVSSQLLMPAMVITVSYTEKQAIMDNFDLFMKIGYDIEEFGANQFKINAVPSNLYGIHERQMFMDFVASLIDNAGYMSNDVFIKKLSTMACKAAIKGNMHITVNEADALVDQLLKLENPYTCPHGRPTIISISESELEKKFKRQV